MRPRLSKIHSMPGTLRSSSVSQEGSARNHLFYPPEFLELQFPRQFLSPPLPTNSTHGKEVRCLVGVRTGDSGTDL